MEKRHGYLARGKFSDGSELSCFVTPSQEHAGYAAEFAPVRVKANMTERSDSLLGAPD